MPSFVTDGNNGMDAPSAIASGFFINKLYYGLPALFMSGALSFFWRPKVLAQYGNRGSAAIMGGASVGSAVIFGSTFAVWRGMDPYEVNNAMSVGGAIGLFAVIALVLVVNYFKKKEDADILEVAAELQEALEGKKPARKAPAKKVVAKKVPAKKVVKK